VVIDRSQYWHCLRLLTDLEAYCQLDLAEDFTTQLSTSVAAAVFAADALKHGAQSQWGPDKRRHGSIG